MTLSLWNKFWFAPQKPHALGLFRIAFGLLLLIILLISIPNWTRFYGAGGTLPFSYIFEPFAGYSWSLFAVSGAQAWTWGLFAAGAAAAILFTVGLFTRSATIALFAVFASMLHRNPFLINGQDEVAVMLLFFMCFAPAGDAMSLDAVIKRFRHLSRSQTMPETEEKPAWAVRLMQVSIAFIYLFSTPSKYLDDVAWRDGSAIYYVTLSPRWFRFPNVPLLHNRLLSSFATFGTLITEMAFPLLVWFKKTRYPVLLAITALHTLLLVFMGTSVFFFNLTMVVSFILFVEPHRIEKAGRRLFKKRAAVLYDGDCSFCIKTMHIFQALDGKANRLTFENLRDETTYKKFPSISPEDARREMHVVGNDGTIHKGFFAFRYLAGVVPGLFPALPFLFVPGASLVGPAIYRFISSRRLGKNVCIECGAGHPTTAHPENNRRSDA